MGCRGKRAIFFSSPPAYLLPMVFVCDQPQRVYSVRISLAMGMNCCGRKRWNLARDAFGGILRGSLGKDQVSLTTARERFPYRGYHM